MSNLTDVATATTEPRIAVRNATITNLSKDDLRTKVDEHIKKGYQFINTVTQVPIGLEGKAIVKADAKFSLLSGQTGWQSKGLSGVAAWMTIIVPCTFVTDKGISYESNLSFSSYEDAEKALGDELAVKSEQMPKKEAGKAMLVVIKNESEEAKLLRLARTMEGAES